MAKYKVTVEELEEQLLDSGEGICLTCGDRSDGVEPDASYYRCERCGTNSVWGLQEAAQAGKVEVV